MTIVGLQTNRGGPRHWGGKGGRPMRATNLSPPNVRPISASFQNGRLAERATTGGRSRSRAARYRTFRVAPLPGGSGRDIGVLARPSSRAPRHGLAALIAGDRHEPGACFDIGQEIAPEYERLAAVLPN